MSGVKVLFSGAPEGDLKALYKKVETINKKSGPFDVLFSIGSYFGDGDDSAEPDADTVSYVVGSSCAPVPTYFIGGYGRGSKSILEALPASESKIKYLGRSGVTKVHGLTIAFLDGTFDSRVYSATAPKGDVATQCRHYTAADVSHLKQQLQELEGEVDLLLTCEWPKAITKGIPENLLPKDLPDTAPGSDVVAELVNLARPRYHLACSTSSGASVGTNVHFVRPPFMHRDLGAGARSTRFVALASLANPAKQKAMHALNLVPCNSMDPSVLSAPPEGATPSPLENKEKRPFPEPEPTAVPNWRFQMPEPKRPRREAPRAIEPAADVAWDPMACIILRNAPWSATADDVAAFFHGTAEVVTVSRPIRSDGKLQSWIRVQFADSAAAATALAKDGADMMGRAIGVELGRAGNRTPKEDGEASRKGVAAGTMDRPQDGCWFCLASSAADTDLVMSVGEHTYLALDKGAISPSHTLVVPVEHEASTAVCPAGCFEEIEKYLSSLRALHKSKSLELVGFERNLSLRRGRGNHCHVNALALAPAAARRAREAFTDELQARGFRIRGSVPGGLSPQETQAQLRELVGDGDYFLAILPCGERLVCPISGGGHFPLGLGREVLANLVGAPERASWKASMATPSGTSGANEALAWAEEFRACFAPFDPMQ